MAAGAGARFLFFALSPGARASDSTGTLPELLLETAMIPDDPRNLSLPADASRAALRRLGAVALLVALVAAMATCLAAGPGLASLFLS